MLRDKGQESWGLPPTRSRGWDTGGPGLISPHCPGWVMKGHVNHFSINMLVMRMLHPAIAGAAEQNQHEGWPAPPSPAQPLSCALGWSRGSSLPNAPQPLWGIMGQGWGALVWQYWGIWVRSEERQHPQVSWTLKEQGWVPRGPVVGVLSPLHPEPSHETPPPQDPPVVTAQSLWEAVCMCVHVCARA